MSQGEGFKHITVTAAEDDDVVIVAGASTHVDSRPQAEPEAEPPAPPVAESARGAAPTAPGQRKPPVSATRARPAKPSREDGYREATLEDLEDTSMPFAQKVVIVAAIVLIVVAVAYYFVALR